MKPQIVNPKMDSLIIKNKFIKAALFVTSILVLAVISGSVYFSERVYITDNGITKELMTSETDVNAILAFGEYTIGEHDRVEYNQVNDNTAEIKIYRSFNIDVIADGGEITVPVIDETVSEALAKANVTLGQHDLVDTDLEQTVSEGMAITVTRVDYKLREDISEIPFETEYTENSNLVIGTERVISEGTNGSKSIIVKEKYIDGKLADEEILSEDIATEPVNAVIERGTALADPYSKMSNPEELELVNGIPASYKRVISGKTTAYTAGINAKTASGMKAEIGTVAVNPNVIPYGSELYIVAQDGSQVYGYAIAADTGLGMMQGTVLADLYFGNKYEYYDDSCRWGAVYCDIYVISEGEGY